MTQTKTLVLEFLDEDDNVKSVVIKDPKDDVSQEDANEVMEAVIDDAVLQSSSGKALASAKAAYYKEVTLTDLEAEEGE